ncbi:MAG TPA: hypothetical protein VF192_00945 [Longimicrobiales bacterium]
MPYETTREQDARIEAMADQYGCARVEPIPPIDPESRHCDILVVGLSGDVEMEFKRIDPDGNEVAAEHMRAGTQEKPRVVQAHPEGFRMILDGATNTAGYQTLADAAWALASVVARTGLPEEVRLKAVVSGAKERELTGRERQQFLDAFHGGVVRRAKDVIA